VAQLGVVLKIPASLTTRLELRLKRKPRKVEQELKTSKVGHDIIMQTT
jgi:hypothetical protein